MTAQHGWTFVIAGVLSFALAFYLRLKNKRPADALAVLGLLSIFIGVILLDAIPT